MFYLEKERFICTYREKERNVCTRAAEIAVASQKKKKRKRI